MLRKPFLLATSVSVFIGVFAASGQQNSDPARDEAKVAGKKVTDFRAADEDYFAQMDHGIKLNPAEIRGRNTWNVWTAGNDRFWDYMANHSFGAFDLLKVLSSSPRVGYCTGDSSGKPDNRYEDGSSSVTEQDCRNAGRMWVAVGRDVRWRYYGLVNEPCFEKATAPDEYGLWVDKRVPVFSRMPGGSLRERTEISRCPDRRARQDRACRFLLWEGIGHCRAEAFPQSRFRRGREEKMGRCPLLRRPRPTTMTIISCDPTGSGCPAASAISGRIR